MEENKQRTLQRNDIAGAITRGDIFDFLVDIVPRTNSRLEFTQLLVFFLVLYPCRISL